MDRNLTDADIGALVTMLDRNNLGNMKAVFWGVLWAQIIFAVIMLVASSAF